MGAGYDFIAIPLAAGILAPIGISLIPAVGAILMSLSTVIVAINAIMLKLDSWIIYKAKDLFKYRKKLLAVSTHHCNEVENYHSAPVD